MKMDYAAITPAARDAYVAYKDSFGALAERVRPSITTFTAGFNAGKQRPAVKKDRIYLVTIDGADRDDDVTLLFSKVSFAKANAFCKAYIKDLENNQDDFTKCLPRGWDEVDDHVRALVQMIDDSEDPDTFSLTKAFGNKLSIGVCAEDAAFGWSFTSKEAAELACWRSYHCQ